MKNRLLNTAKIDWDNEKPSPEYFQELFRVSQNQIIWGGNYFELPPCRGFAVWNKLQPWDNFSQAEFAWTSFDIPAKLLSLSNTGGANKETKIHPTQKSVALYKWLLRNYAKLSYKILDTHLGSASSRIAAYKLGFDFWATELDEQYFNDSGTRFKKAVSMPLFDIPPPLKQTQLFQ